MNVCSLLSGGKDSIYALYWAMNQAWDVKCLVSIVPRTQESWMFHYPNTWLTKLQSEAIGLPQIVIETNGKKESELNDLTSALKIAKDEYNIEGIISGALASEYQRTRIETVCHKLGLKSFTPLWHKEQSSLLEDMIRAGFEIMIVGVYADGLDDSWLGRIIDTDTIKRLKELYLKRGIWPAGEGGEYETLVLDGPIFKRRIVIDEYEKDWDTKTHSGSLRVIKAHLDGKV